MGWGRSGGRGGLGVDGSKGACGSSFYKQTNTHTFRIKHYQKIVQMPEVHKLYFEIVYIIRGRLYLCNYLCYIKLHCLIVMSC